MRVLNWGNIASGFFVSILAECGGSHGGGYGSTMPPPTTMPAPTITFSQPAAAATINLGQAVTVAWTTANATTCTATTSSAAGGAFTGSQMMSGSKTIVP